MTVGYMPFKNRSAFFPHHPNEQDRLSVHHRTNAKWNRHRLRPMTLLACAWFLGMHGKDCAGRITNYTLCNTANKHSDQAGSIMPGNYYYFSANFLLGLNDLFYRMTGAEYWLCIHVWELLLNDPTKTLDRIFKSTLCDDWSTYLQRVQWAEHV